MRPGIIPFILLVLVLCPNWACTQPDSSITDHENCTAADSLFALYQFERAAQAYKMCCNDRTKSAYCWKKLAQCQVQLGRYAEARETYNAVLESDSNDVSTRNQLARLYRKTGDEKRARALYYGLVLSDSTNAYYHRQVADCAMNLGDILSALGHLQSAHRLSGENIAVITDMARIFYGLDALAAADSVIALGYAVDSTYAPLLLQGVKSSYRQKKYDAVVQHVDRILRTTRDSSAYLLKLLGVSAFHTGDQERAIETLRTVIARGQESEVVYYYLGLALRETGRTAESASAFQSAIEAGTSKNLDNYYTDMAVAFEEMGDHQSAIRAYQAAYKSSGNEILLYHLARNYDAYYKDKKTALRYYERFLAANDSNSNIYTDYTEHRINELKEVMHFEIDTLE